MVWRHSTEPDTESHRGAEEDGWLVIPARRPAEQGAPVVKALEKAVETDVSAETLRRVQIDGSTVRVTENDRRSSGRTCY